jgi:hypothetical protein
MKTKLEQVKELWLAGNKIEALRIVKSFPRLGDEKKAIEQAWASHQSPSFYIQIGKDPEALIGQGLQAIAHRYSLPL